MEHARAQVGAAPPAQRKRRWTRKMALRQVVARPFALKVACWPARAWAGSRLRALSARVGLLRLLPFLKQLPARPGRPFRPGDALAQPAVATGRMVLFTGCVMGELFGRVHRATGRLLARRGVACDAPGGQGCCGALHAHDGDLDFARTRARRTIEAFEASDPAPIVVNSAGCGAAMKEYGDLLGGDPEWAERAKRFALRVRDLSEILADLPAVPARHEGRVSYQHPCHLAHAQRVREQPLRLIDGVEGCERVVNAGDDVCCGAAGIYSLVEPGMSRELRNRKAESFRSSGAGTIVTANPGCQMQYASAAAGTGTRVQHLAEFLDDAERRARQG